MLRRTQQSLTGPLPVAGACIAAVTLFFSTIPAPAFDDSRPSGETAIAEPSDPDSAPQFTERPAVGLNPNRSTPLAAVVTFAVNRPVTASLEIREGDGMRSVTFPDRAKRKHRLQVLGLKPARAYELRLVLHDGNESYEIEQALPLTTDELPDGFPPLKCLVSKPDRIEPGVTLFNCFQWVNDEANEGLGYLIAVDGGGDVVWSFCADHPISDVKRLDNGNLVYLRQHRVHPWTEAVEIDMLGNVVREWYAAARVAPGSGPAGAVSLNVDTLHHDVVETAKGNLRAITTEVRGLPRYPTSDVNPSARRAPANVVGDVIVEFQPDGTIVKRWHLLDLLDPTRVGRGSCSHFWDTRCYAAYRASGGTRDWSHANGLYLDPETGAMIVSARHQDAVFKIDPKTGTVGWILANPAGWSERFQKLLLKPEGEVEWPYHQHSPKLTADGTLLVYDNGNYRAPAHARTVPPTENRTRVVEYAIDEKRRTVKQLWQYQGEKPYLCPLFGDVDLLPETGNVLITDGGILTDRRNRRTYEIPADRQWARIVEIDRDAGNDKVFELHVGSDERALLGWSVYRSERLPSLYHAAKVSGNPDRKH